MANKSQVLLVDGQQYFFCIDLIACNMGLAINRKRSVMEGRRQQRSALPHLSFAITCCFNLNGEKSPQLKIITHFSVISSSLQPTGIRLKCTHIYNTLIVGLKLLCSRHFQIFVFHPSLQWRRLTLWIIKTQNSRKLHIKPVIYPQRRNTLVRLCGTPRMTFSDTPLSPVWTVLSPVFRHSVSASFSL